MIYPGLELEVMNDGNNKLPLASS
ncbi:hypothetical protein L8106_02047 [Lyngbya sp. PCC 8106]|nr:hypothetical protein L8106_02047 [Lyngbya sp. PCC 8106]